LTLTPGHHEPVLLREVLESLAPQTGEVFVDATVGLGGHSVEILPRLGDGLLIGIDRDAEALAIARSRLEAVGGSFRLVNGVFSDLRRCLEELAIGPEGALDGVLFDLGVSSLQLDRAERGFSFLRDGPLDMRMDSGSALSATEYLRDVTPQELASVLRMYGEEPAAHRVARAICRASRTLPIVSTLQLAGIVEGVLPRHGKKKHPATRTFQAIRIAVNRELEHLELVLRDLDRWVKPGGRVVVLSYHSLEDRIVKNTFGEQIKSGFFSSMSRLALRPGADEIAANPRARSAKCRGVVRCGA
jgi:16S rRNA (cytosine1402-N4)-methyltransferase